MADYWSVVERTSSFNSSNNVTSFCHAKVNARGMVNESFVVSVEVFTWFSEER